MDQSRTYHRYQRQMLLKEFGEAGQHKLQAARVLVAGAGGLGCPVLQYLAAAGIGTIAVVDDDQVALHNLHRQVLYATGDVGKSKAITAAEKLRLLNPDITIEAYPVRLSENNALDLIRAYDMVVDGTDNFATRYLINDACVLLGKPLVFGAIARFEGQVSLFNVPSQDGQSIHYRDIFPVPPQEGEVLNCAEAGVLGVLPGMIGTLMATEVIKWFAGLGKSLAGQLLTWNALTQQQHIWQLDKHPESDALVPTDETAYRRTNYAWLCVMPAGIAEIDVEEFQALAQRQHVTVVDVREYGEIPLAEGFSCQQLPWSVMQQDVAALARHEGPIVFFCQSGKRSVWAAQFYTKQYGPQEVYSLRGGILAWQSHIQHQQT